MSEENGKPIFGLPVRSVDEAGRLIGRLFDVARPDAVFGGPLTQDATTVIVASRLCARWNAIEAVMSMSATPSP